MILILSNLFEKIIVKEAPNNSQRNVSFCLYMYPSKRLQLPKTYTVDSQKSTFYRNYYSIYFRAALASYFALEITPIRYVLKQKREEYMNLHDN